MTSLSYQHDPTDLILSQLRNNPTSTEQQLSYFQVNYLQKNILKLNPEQAKHYERSLQQENMKEYLDQDERDNNKYLHLKHSLKTSFFKIRSSKPPLISDATGVNDPIQMIKSYSQPNAFLSKSKIAEPFRQNILSKSVVSKNSISNLKCRYSDQVKVLLDSSLKLTEKKSKYHLRGGTMMEKEKIGEKIMKQQKRDILQLIKTKNYGMNRPHCLEQIPNKERYALDFLEYMRLKTKSSLNRQVYQKRIRKPSSRLQNFQQFILEEGKFKGESRQKLTNFYIGMRDEFRRIQRNGEKSFKRLGLEVHYQ